MCKRFACASLLIACSIAALIASGCGDDGDKPAAADPTPVPTGTPAPLTTAALLEPGPDGVGVTTITFVDTSRPTMANGSYAGAASRTLPTEIWYPTGPDATASEQEQRDAPVASVGRPFPLIMYSHGFLSDRLGGAYLARHLASYGYIVASIDFPLTSNGAPGGPNVADVVHQPGDVSFVIDQLVTGTGAVAPFSGAIDSQRIALTGLSLGGLTTYLGAFHPTLRDPRVRAAAPIAGPGCFYTPAFFNARPLPLLIVHGSLDAIVPYAENAVHAFQEAAPPKYLVTLIGGTHTAFADFGTGIALFDRAGNPDNIGCAGLGSALSRGGQDFLSALGGPENGVVAGDCPAPCSDPTPRPTAMKATRQHLLTLASVLPFFEATLRGSQPARQFLEQTLASENSDLQVQFTSVP